MPLTHDDTSEVPSAFRLGEWFVEPMLNRITRDGQSVQLRPRAMDVLVFLAQKDGEVATKEQVIDAVWRTEFVTENALTHIISELRTELGDDARNPRYIENIPRRGYRLIAEVEVQSSRPHGVAEVIRMPTADGAPQPETDINPYPGLAPFTEKDAPFFFGREAEIGQMWRAISSRRLLAVIGPSGVGKSSFLGAGVKPAAPEGWAVVVCQPGESPFASFARAFLPEFAGDVEAIEGLFEIRDGASALPMISRWRQRYDRALLVVDQFEELFTLSPIETQKAFVGLIGSLVEHTDLHFLLSMRDDFLHRCHAHQPLRPIFDQLTALEAPDADALRLAVVEPASGLGFEFEDDLMASEMVAEVENERAALPLLAFSVAQLWDRRDRERRVLSRTAYESIGGVTGSLARHADTTLEGLGRERLSMVRDLFRNLVTAENTRAVREYNELLSVFADDERDSADQVVRHLIDARLLTSYEDEQPGAVSARRVEIIHESLLTNWPRLVRWRSQDADAARFRDELRQAARTWNERDRNKDLLWTGSAFREYQLWREQYPGGLSESEQAFGAAMTAHEFRRQRVRGWVFTAAFVALLAVLLVVSGFWRQSVRETRRAEAAKLLALGQVALTEERTTALAYAMASLELADTPEARRLALTALWAGPPATVVMPKGNIWWITFTPDGDRMAVGSKSGRIFVFSRRPEPPVELTDFQGRGISFPTEFSPDSRRLVGGISDTRGPTEVRLWDVETAQTVRVIEVPGFSVATGIFDTDGRTILSIGALNAREASGATVPGYGRIVIQRWPPAGEAPELVGSVDAPMMTLAWMDPVRRLVAIGEGNELLLFRLDGFGRESPTIVGRHPEPFVFRSAFAFHPTKDSVAACDGGGNLMLWPLDGDGTRSERRIEAPLDPMSITFNSDGRLLACASRNGFRLWDFEGPVGAPPLVFGNAGRHIAFTPDDRWLATAGWGYTLALWPLTSPYVRFLHGHETGAPNLTFSADGSRLYSQGGSDGRVLSWDLDGGAGLEPTVVFETSRQWGWGLEVDRRERFVIASYPGGIWKVPLDGGEPQLLEDFPRQGFRLSPSGQRLAVRLNRKRGPVLYALDLETGESQMYNFPGEGDLASWSYESDEQLLVVQGGVLYRWIPETGSEQVLIAKGVDTFARGPDYVDGFARGPVDRQLLCRVNGSIIDLDLESGTQTPLDLPDGNSRLGSGPAGPIVLTRADNGETFVAPLGSEKPHLLLGKELAQPVISSPDGRWIASSAFDGTIRLWPMPDFSKPPLHTLPHDELMATLESLTNLRVVPDDVDSTGYRVEADMDAYRGWQTPPEW
jgi:DNA-binding winged helix-turn-helix (wHTH) protein/WD40 repeat protein